ncbi:MAG: dephospho-CoA kinase [Pedobacter sp.]|nr:MAG: dephospho-CoA kinase [Pedobacter sp.]
MKVFLIGFMGCGKSTKARQLANKLNCPVIDLDAVIVAQQKQSIAEYFSEYGEKSFRELERETLKNYPYPETCIIATGGGLPCFFDNMDWMNENGRTVYLQMTPPQLVSRLHNREKRPLLKGMDDEQLLAFVKLKLEERNPFYTQAQLVVDAFSLEVDELVASLKR